jgi:hypothetical protein
VAQQCKEMHNLGVPCFNEEADAENRERMLILLQDLLCEDKSES